MSQNSSFSNDNFDEDDLKIKLKFNTNDTLSFTKLVLTQSI